jgi:diguanylate cyclase (GGDEF)-like protein
MLRRTYSPAHQKTAQQWLIGIALAAFLVHVLLLVIPADDFTEIIISDWLQTVVVACAAGLLWMVSRRYPNPADTSRRRFWHLLSVAMLVWFIGDIFWNINETILRVSPFPSKADIFYLSFYLVFGIAILSVPSKGSTTGQKLRLLLDLAIVAASGALLFANLAIGPLLTNPARASLQQTLTIAYPALDLVLFWLLMLMLFRSRPAARWDEPLLLITLGVVVLIISDSFFSFAYILQDTVAGLLNNLVWMLSHLLMALAGSVQLYRIDHVPEDQGDLKFYDSGERWVAYLPDIWLLIDFMILVWAANTPLWMSLVDITVSVVGISSLALLRQVWLMVENSKLIAQLTSAKTGLEQRVDQRTSELQQMNDHLQTEIHERKAAEKELRLRADKLEMVRQMTLAISSELDLDTLVQNTAENIQYMLRASAVYFYRYEAAENVLILDYGSGNLAFEPGMVIPAGSGAAGLAIQNGYSVSIGNYEEWEGSLPQFAARKPRALLCLPVISGNERLGVLTVSRRIQNPFDETEIHLAELLVSHVAIAMQNSQLFAQTRTLAITDPLTGILNRRHFYTLAEIELDRTHRLGKKLALIILDIDHFKQVNDTYGHIAGDAILKELVQRCQTHLRDYDLIGRYGGEEFVVLLPETNHAQALQAAERLCNAIASDAYLFNGNFIQITASVGYAIVDKLAAAEGLSIHLQHADEAMYAAKQNGGNQIRLWQPAVDQVNA